MGLTTFVVLLLATPLTAIAATVPPWAAPPRSFAQEIGTEAADYEEGPPWENRGPVAYITWGVAGATAIGGVVAGIRVRTAAAGWATAKTDLEWQAARADARNAATVANMVWISAGVLAVAGTGLFFFTRW